MKAKQGILKKGQHELQLLREENQSLRAELEEARETLTAIQGGMVDALVIDTPEGQRIFTLEGAEHSYRALIEQMDEGALTLKADGTIHYCNRGFADLLKRPLEQIVGTAASRYVIEPDRPVFEALLRQGLVGSARGEISFASREGGLIPAQVGLAPLVDGGPGASLSMVITNLTERKRAEHVLASAQFARRLIDTTPIGVAVVGKDLRYILANPAYQSIAGDSAAPIAGRTLSDVFPPAVAQLIERPVRQVFESGHSNEFRELEVPLRGGTWWNVTEIPLRDSDGQTEAVLLLTQEITERKQAEAALAAAKVAAEAANAAKDEFIGVLSHELRTPLNPVLAAASMLLKDPRFDADTRNHLEIICRNVELEARLIDDLLDVTRIERGKIELDRRTIELGTIIQRAVEVCLPDIEAQELDFGIDAPDGPYWMDADAGRLQQVFWNILKNAIKFTPRGGCVGIRCRQDGLGFVVIQVNDSGMGIDSPSLERIFKAFEQAERSVTRQFGGLGLGLTISKAIVDIHGGTIQATSGGKDKGATLTVRLPLRPVSASMSAPPPNLETRVPVTRVRPLRILLVEDHGDTARIMRRLLSANGHEVEAAADIATALALAEKQSFDLLLSDLGLPDGSGLDLMRALRAKGIDLPGIAMSGYGRETDMRQSREAGFLIHLTKPVNLAKLDEAIAKVAEGGQVEGT